MVKNWWYQYVNWCLLDKSVYFIPCWISRFFFFTSVLHCFNIVSCNPLKSSKNYALAPHLLRLQFVLSGLTRCWFSPGQPPGWLNWQSSQKNLEEQTLRQTRGKHEANTRGKVNKTTKQKKTNKNLRHRKGLGEGDKEKWQPNESKENKSVNKGRAGKTRRMYQSVTQPGNRGCLFSKTKPYVLW